MKHVANLSGWSTRCEAVISYRRIERALSPPTIRAVWLNRRFGHSWQIAVHHLISKNNLILLSILGMFSESNDFLFCKTTTKITKWLQSSHESFVFVHKKSWACVIRLMTVVAKRELLFAGTFGEAVWLVGLTYISRHSSEKSRETLNGVLKKLNRVKLWVFPEPEGTRRITEGIYEFKKGAFLLSSSANHPSCFQFVSIVSRWNLNHRNVQFICALSISRGLLRLDWVNLKIYDWSVWWSFGGDNENESEEFLKREVI